MFSAVIANITKNANTRKATALTNNLLLIHILLAFFLVFTSKDKIYKKFIIILIALSEVCRYNYISVF